MEIASRIPLVLYKTEIGVSRYPKTGRIKNIVDSKEYYKKVIYVEGGGNKSGHFRRAEVIYMNPPQSPFIKGGSQNEVEAGGFLSDFQGYNKNGEWFINPEIMEKVIVDKGGNYYKIVKMEYDFLMKYALPLATNHWLDRIKDGLKK